MSIAAQGEYCHENCLTRMNPPASEVYGFGSSILYTLLLLEVSWYAGEAVMTWHIVYWSSNAVPKLCHDIL
jgi:hypothetical protein